MRQAGLQSGRHEPSNPEGVRVRRMHGSKSSVVALEQKQSEEAPVSPLYGVALLRIALELKKPRSGSLDTIIRRVMARMDLEEAPFRAWLEQNEGLLRTLSPQRG
jgi:hypothetical protein